MTNLEIKIMKMQETIRVLNGQIARLHNGPTKELIVEARQVAEIELIKYQTALGEQIKI